TNCTQAAGVDAFIKGRKFGYGEAFDCNRKEAKNWIALYDPAVRSETVLFDQPLPFNRDISFCIFEQMQLSPDGTVLYLVSPVYPTSGSLAIVQLKSRMVTYVPGVNEVYVIEAGSHRGELIYTRRLYRRSSRDDEGEYPYYPFVHAHADGRQ